MRKTPTTPDRAPITRLPRAAGAALALLGLLIAPSWAAAQEATLNRVVDGDFESGLISLSLPAVRRFPVFSGGWASRGARAPEIVEAGYTGSRAIRVTSRPGDPLQLLQDLPFDGSGFGLRLAFWVEDGSQTLRLLSTWDRRDPAGGQLAFEVTLARNELRFATPEGRWAVNADLAPGSWHTLSVLADPRAGVQYVRLDGRPLVSLPGVPSRRPSTLLLGGIGPQSGSFRYDAVEIASLVDFELAVVRTGGAGLGVSARQALLARLDAAGMALERDAPALALSELGVAEAMLGSYASRAVSPPTGVTSAEVAALAATLRQAVQRLSELIEIEAAARRAAREASSS